MRLAKSAAWAALLAPVFYIGLQPWLWHETASRIVSRFFHYAEKTPIPLYYLGTVYGESNPWHYPFVMVLFTIPVAILVFLLAGLADPIGSKRAAPPSPWMNRHPRIRRASIRSWSCISSRRYW
jgi:hypothetical protein